MALRSHPRTGPAGMSTSFTTFCSDGLLVVSKIKFPKQELRCDTRVTSKDTQMRTENNRKPRSFRGESKLWCDSTSFPALLMKHRPGAAPTTPGAGHPNMTVGRKERDANASKIKAARGEEVPEIMSRRRGNLQRRGALLPVPGALRFLCSVWAPWVQLGLTGRCYLETDFVFHISKPQNCPETEWTPLGVVVSASSLKGFKHSVQGHLAEKVWSLKYLSLAKLKQGWLSGTSGIDGASNKQTI